MEQVRSKYFRKDPDENRRRYILKFQQFLKMKNFSEPTIRTYSSKLNCFLKFYQELPADQITPELIRKYIIHLVKIDKHSVSSQNSTVSALKIFYNDFLQKKVDAHYLPRPKRPNRMPLILNELEIASILKEITEIRDKCMIFLIYSAGLRPVEILYLKPEQIDTIRKRIYITSPHGDRDRYVLLADKVLILLQKYYEEYKPEKWLFEQNPGKQYSRRKLQKRFQQAVVKSGISKPATLTVLKNSFAVHLIEKGIDVLYVKKMLGHKKIASTLKYLKASKRDLNSIKSPLDNLDI
jgi:integrase/recombinase XerD